MCIICDMQQLNEMHANASLALVKTLAETTHKLIKFLDKHSGAFTDHVPAETDLEALLIDAKRVMQGMGAQMAGGVPADKAIITEALQRAFPGARIMTGTPEEIEAELEKIAKPNDTTKH